MTNYLERAANILADKFEQHASVLITYRRAGEFEYVGIPATPGSTPQEILDMNGQPMQYASTDFSVKRVHLGYNEPKRNDVIEHQFGNLLLIYLVAPDGALAHFQPSDSYGVSWRIRAKVHEVRKICQ